MNSYMDDLTPEQYQTVLKYMQIADEDDFQNAKAVMAQSQFKLDNAFNGLNSSDNRLGQKGNSREEQNAFENYASYVREKQKRGRFMRYFGGKVRRLCSSCSKITLPCIHRKLFGPQFNSVYHQTLTISVKTNLHETVSNARKQSKPCMVLLSSPTINHSLLELMQTQTIPQQINKYFEVVGVIEGSSEISDYPQLEHEHAPSIIICRRDITDKVIILKSYFDDRRIVGFDLREIEAMVKQFQRLQQSDSNAVRRFNNQNSSQGNHRLISPNLPLPQDQDSGYEELDNYTQTDNHVNSSRMIHQQNWVYKKIQEQAMKKRLSKEESDKLQQLQKQKEMEVDQQRKVRKISIPDEPQDGDFVRLSFRCPQGNVVVRNFPTNQKMELVYNWVETNDEIEFQNEVDREFDLFMSYPPVSLSERKLDLLREVFHDCQEKIMIREL